MKIKLIFKLDFKMFKWKQINMSDMIQISDLRKVEFNQLNPTDKLNKILFCGLQKSVDDFDNEVVCFKSTDMVRTHQ